MPSSRDDSWLGEFICSAYVLQAWLLVLPLGDEV